MINWKQNKKKIGIKIPYFYLIWRSKGNIKKFRVNKRIYDLLKDSEWIDKKFYYKNYPNVKKSRIDPLLHYILFGYKEGKFPSSKFKNIYKASKNFGWFDEKYYLKKYPDIKRTGLDPILDYILFGYSKSLFPSDKFEKIYNILKISNLFDENYYLNNNTEIKKSGLDPLFDYIFSGYKKGKLPSNNFDGDFYLNLYKNVNNLGFNPLVHYVLYGKNEGKVIKSYSEDYKFVKYSDNEINDILLALNSKIDIIMYIHNDFEDTEKCITSILENTKINYELTLVDDNSTDRRISTLLNKLKKLQNVRLIKNNEKLGFIKSVNQEIKNSQCDILIIKSNFIVTSRWLQKLVVTAYSNKKIGTVIPLSNSAKFLSNIIPKTQIRELTPEDIAYLIENISEHLRPKIEYPDESCIYIKRELINNVGLYNEENNDSDKDLFQKISSYDWKNIIDDSTYIHQNLNSYDKEPKIPINISSPQIEKIFKLRAKNFDFSIPKKKVLYVIHENIHGFTGGTGQTTRDMLETIDKTFECYVLVSSGKELTLWKREDNQTILIKSWNIRSEWSFLEFNNKEFKNIYFQVLINLNIDIVHIQHLIGHTHDLPLVAKNLGIPIVLSFHDFFYICPSIHLLDNENHYCSSQCAENQFQCSTHTIFDHLPISIDLINAWRKEGSLLIDTCTAFIAPSNSTMDLYLSVYPQLKDKNYKVIEHGLDLEKTNIKFQKPSKKNPIKILIPGNINNNKGHDFINALIEKDHQNLIEFHFMGIIYGDLREKGIYHGKYKNENFSKITNEIKPSFIGIFSIWPETYCRVLTEAWSCGIPVLATKLGALEERIEKNGGGWFLELESPLNAYNEIIRIANSDKDYLNVAEQVSKISFKSRKEMISEYEHLYYDLIANDSYFE